MGSRAGGGEEGMGFSGDVPGRLGETPSRAPFQIRRRRNEFSPENIRRTEK